MIAYDFDGVLLSDCRSGANRMDVLPNFIPEGDYVILSGRNWVGAGDEMSEWIKRNLRSNLPKRIVHPTRVGEDYMAFKLTLLEVSTDIDTFVESDIEVIRFLAKNLKRQVRLLHFGTLIQKALAAPSRRTLELSYDAVEKMCLEMAMKAKETSNPDIVIAVMRGGMFPAQVIAKALKLPIGVYYPGAEHPADKLRLPPKLPIALHSYLFIDDEVAIGRTYNEIGSFMDNTLCRWRYASIIVDSEFPDDPRLLYGIKTEDWVVLPWRRHQKQRVMEVASGTRIYNREDRPATEDELRALGTLTEDQIQLALKNKKSIMSIKYAQMH